MKALDKNRLMAAVMSPSAAVGNGNFPVQTVSSVSPEDALWFLNSHHGVNASVDRNGRLIIQLPGMYSSGDLTDDSLQTHIVHPGPEGFDSGTLRSILGY